MPGILIPVTIRPESCFAINNVGDNGDFLSMSFKMYM